MYDIFDIFEILVFWNCDTTIIRRITIISKQYYKP